MKIYFAGPLFTPYERSFIDECAAALRADGFEVFVPHEHELATGVDVTAAWIFAKDRPGIEGADAMLAILDGPSVDDGTACEIGMFHALMQSDPSKKGIVGLLTDIRGMRGESTGINLFVKGAIEDVGRIVTSIDEAHEVLGAWSKRGGGTPKSWSPACTRGSGCCDRYQLWGIEIGAAPVEICSSNDGGPIWAPPRTTSSSDRSGSTSTSGQTTRRPRRAAGASVRRCRS